MWSRLFAELPRYAVDQFHRWSKNRDIVLYATAFAVTALLFVFFRVADEVAEKSWTSLDDRILLALRETGSLSNPIGPPWVERVFRDITVLGGVVVVTLVTVVAVCHLLLLREWRTAIVFVVVVSTGGAASSVLKAFFDRPRPAIVEPIVVASGLSFPSGHSLISAVVYPTLGALLARVVRRPAMKLYIVTVSLCLTFIIGISRVYLGVHYPSDVLAGWTLGLAFSLTSWGVLRKLQHRGVVEAGPRAPASAEPIAPGS